MDDEITGQRIRRCVLPGVNQATQAQVIPIKAGEEVRADVALRRVKTVDIAGRVIGPSGPVADTMVRLETADRSDSDFDRRDNTDEKGNSHLRGVPEGTYYIVAYQRQESASSRRGYGRRLR